MKFISQKKGFTLLEILIVVAIIGILSFVIFPQIGKARIKANDARRKAEISQMGILVKLGCYMPLGGAGIYDLKDLIPEILAQNPNYSEWIKQIPEDPKATETESLYKYIVDNNNKCALYTNLENENENVTLNSINTATPGGGTGVFEGLTDGPNGTNKYFQISN